MLNGHSAPALHRVLQSFPLEKAQAQHCCHMLVPAHHQSFTRSILHQHPMETAGRIRCRGRSGQCLAPSQDSCPRKRISVKREREVCSHLGRHNNSNFCLCYSVHIPPLIWFSPPLCGVICSLLHTSSHTPSLQCLPCTGLPHSCVWWTWWIVSGAPPLKKE